MSRLFAFACLLALPTFALAADKEVSKDAEGWIQLFDGKTLDGWKASEHTESWKIEEGAIVCQGERSHLFYVGPGVPFKDFEFSVDLKTTPGSNGGVYFHTKWQEEGWPKYGYEAQVNQTHGDPKKSASLYGTVNVTEAPAKDGEWYTMTVKVQGNHVTIAVDGKTLVDYEEPAGKEAFSADFERRLTPEGGTFALQCHDPKSVVYFKNLKVKPL